MASVVGALTGGVAGIAVGQAASVALDPVFEPVKQDAWRNKPTRIHELPQLAALVAQALVSLEDVTDHAKRGGYGPDELNSAVQLALRAPGVPEALDLYRRRNMQEGGSPFSLAQLHHSFAKAQIEYQYWPALESLADLPLEPSVIANAIVRGIIAAPFPLPYTPPTGTGKVNAFPQSSLDATKEAAASGTNVDRLFVQTAIAGRPMAPEEAATATFRGILEPDDYLRAILEGDIRGEWAAAIFERARQIPTAHDGVEMRLRNYFTTDQEMYDFTHRHGMSEADTDVLFQVTGRPLGFHQAFIGTRRGGELGGPIDDIDPAFLDSLRKSNIRPEYYNLAWAQRYTYPSAFVLRALATGGDLTQAETEQILLFEGWEPGLAKTVSTNWTAGTTAAVKPKKLTNATIRSAWKKGNLTKEQALTDLEGNGLSAADAAIYLES